MPLRIPSRPFACRIAESVLCGQSAHFYGELAYDDYDGVSDDVQEKEALAAAIGDKSVLIMRNHGETTSEFAVVALALTVGVRHG